MSLETDETFAYWEKHSDYDSYDSFDSYSVYEDRDDDPGRSMDRILGGLEQAQRAYDQLSTPDDENDRLAMSDLKQGLDRAIRGATEFFGL